MTIDKDLENSLIFIINLCRIIFLIIGSLTLLFLKLYYPNANDKIKQASKAYWEKIKNSTNRELFFLAIRKTHSYFLSFIMATSNNKIDTLLNYTTITLASIVSYSVNAYFVPISFSLFVLFFIIFSYIVKMKARDVIIDKNKLNRLFKQLLSKHHKDQDETFYREIHDSYFPDSGIKLLFSSILAFCVFYIFFEFLGIYGLYFIFKNLNKCPLYISIPLSLYTVPALFIKIIRYTGGITSSICYSYLYKGSPIEMNKIDIFIINYIVLFISLLFASLLISIPLTFSSFFIGQLFETIHNCTRPSLRFYIVNILADTVTLSITIKLLNYIYKKRILVYAIPIFLLDIFLATILSFLAIYLSTIRTPCEKSFKYIFYIFFGYDIQNSCFSLNALFWAMHTTFLPTLLYLSILFFFWSSNIFYIFFIKITKKAIFPDRNPVEFFTFYLLLIGFILEIIVNIIN